VAIATTTNVSKDEDEIDAIFFATTNTTSEDGDDDNVDVMLDHAVDDDANDDALFRLSTDFSTPMAGMIGQQPSTLSPSQSLDTNSPKIVRHIRLSLPGSEPTMAQGRNPFLPSSKS